MRKHRFDVGLDFVLLLAVFYLIDTQNLFFLAMIAAILHELGHILAIWLCGAYIDRIELRAYGAHIALMPYPLLSYKREIFIAAAGPIAGFAAATLLSVWGNELCTLIAGFSLMLSIFNLLPAAPLDGGRMLRYTALLTVGEVWQARICKAGNIISAVLIIALCVVVSVCAGVSPSLCVFCAFIAISFFKEP